MINRIVVSRWGRIIIIIISNQLMILQFVIPVSWQSKQSDEKLRSLIHCKIFSTAQSRTAISSSSLTNWSIKPPLLRPCHLTIIWTEISISCTLNVDVSVCVCVCFPLINSVRWQGYKWIQMAPSSSETCLEDAITDG